ncbi:MAG TPA: rhomboid family intramembrane serine protease, partial [Lactobacillus acetotolerans]|nr:rhomboid family intramembrane serine protease [Lactobacillus acetotolerans]
MNQRLNLKDCYMTIAILGGLLMIFITEMFMGGSENNEVLLKMGAMSNYAIVAGGQWWR